VTIHPKPHILTTKGGVFKKVYGREIKTKNTSNLDKNNILLLFIFNILYILLILYSSKISYCDRQY